jgi:hypothetical protein
LSEKFLDLNKASWKPEVRSFNGTGCSFSGTALLHPVFQVLHVIFLEGRKLTADCSDGLNNAWTWWNGYLGSAN